MPAAVPNSSAVLDGTELAVALDEILSCVQSFVGASVGWVGVLGPDGLLTFPVRRGPLPEAWLTLQQARDTLWGFTVRAGPTRLNELPPLPLLGDPPVRNLLSCPLAEEGRVLGHVVLANKPAGFTEYDLSVLQGYARLLSRRVYRSQLADMAEDALPPRFLRLALDHVQEGVFVADETGTLVYANAT